MFYREAAEEIFLEKLVQLSTPLGGEAAALVREEAPNHPYLRCLPFLDYFLEPGYLFWNFGLFTSQCELQEMEYTREGRFCKASCCI